MMSSDYYIQDNSDIENKKLEAAKGLYQRGDYATALKLYLDIVNTSYSYKIYYDIGRCYYKLNDLVNAEKFFMRSIELDDNKNPSYNFLGNIFYKTQNTGKAIEYWTIAYSFKPDDESVCLNLATSYFSKDMKFQSIYFYNKYLKYAKDKTSAYYLEIKKSTEEFSKLGEDFYQKSLTAVSMRDNKTAIQALEYAVKNSPLNFDINFLLGKLYFEEKEPMKALVYLKQAYCLDNKSLDVLERLSSVMLELGDFTGAYCCLKRMLPLVIHNQKEYLGIMKNLRQLEGSFDNLSYKSHEEWGDSYYKENNYLFALFEYENSIIISGVVPDELDEKIQRLRSFVNPEDRIIKSCFERGGAYYSTGDFRTSNKYFTRIMTLSERNSSEYRFARSRIMHV